MTLLDTNIISALLWPDVPERIRVETAAQPALHTTAINLAEILYGIERRRSQRLRDRYETEVFPLLTVLPFDARAAEHYGRVRAHLEASGQRLDNTDLMIAAVALVNDALLVTGNTAHFARVPGLRLENWLEG